MEYGKRTTRGRVRHLMRKMGIRAIYRAPRTSLPGKGTEHKVHPYLLRKREVKAADEVWCTDITDIPMERGHAYLVAIMDWHTRSVISWRLSNTLDNVFIKRLRRTLKYDELHLREFNTLPELEEILGNWFELYNTWRPHDSLGGSRSWEIYRPKPSLNAA